MEFPTAYLPAQACAESMFIHMRPMATGTTRQSHDTTDVGTRQEIAELWEELERLRAERALACAGETRDG